MSIILFIIFALSISALVIGCIAYTDHQKSFPPSPSFKPFSEITCTKLGGIPVENGCEFPDTYAKGFKQCTEQIIHNKVIIPWDKNEISRQCHTLFPKNPIDGPEPPPLTANSALTCCGPPSRICHSGACCCNLFGCNCNNCEGNESGCDEACYQCGSGPYSKAKSRAYGTYGDDDELDWACDPNDPTLCGDLCDHAGCVCNVTVNGVKKSCWW